MKRINRIITALAAAALVLSACDAMDSSFQEFLEDGPIVYIGKVDSIKVLPGNKEARIEWQASSDARIKGAIISWANGESSKDIAWNYSEPFSALIDGLSEGSVVFEIVTYDSFGNKSIPVSVSSNIYGDSFASLIDDKATITSGFFDETAHTVDLTFRHSPNYYYVGLGLTYVNLAGDTCTVVVPSDTLSMRIDSVKTPEIHYYGCFLPEENCIDTYTSASVLYDDLYNPYCKLTGDAPFLSYMSGAASSTTFEANRAPVAVVLPEDCWADAVVEGTTVTFTAKSDNGRTAARSFTAKLKAGTFEESIVVTQTKDRRGEAYDTLGVVFWQDQEDPTKYKIISAKRGNCKFSTEKYNLGIHSGTYQLWSKDSKNWTAVTGVTTINGVERVNNEVIAERIAVVGAGSYPAYEWCVAQGEGWYFPCGLELKAVYEAYNNTTFDSGTAGNPEKLTQAEKDSRAAFDNTLSSLPGGAALNTQAANKEGDWVWSSMEDTSASQCVNKAMGFRFGNKGYGARDKFFDASSATVFYARAVKAVTIAN